MSQAQLIPTADPIPTFPAIAYKGTPVLTTEMLAHAYGVDAVRIRQNFSRNAQRFTCGKHYFQLSGNELKAFKDCVSFSDTVAIPARTKNLTLWTDRGSARHAKMLESDKAWDVYEMLEDTFFAVPTLDKLAAEERAQLPADVNPKREPVRPPTASSNTRKPGKFYCTDTQMRPLDDAINTWAKRSKMSRLEALRRVREHFGINRFWTWPVERMEPAIEWVRQQSALAVPAVPTLPAIPAEAIPADMPASFKTALADVNKWAGQWGGTVNWLHIACRPRKACQRMLPEDQALFDALEELNAVAVTSAQTVRFALRAMHALGRDMRRAAISAR